MECKGIRLALRSYRSMDLIETSWNVKVKSFVLNSEENLDLIETLWNVKTLFAMNGSRGMGFNRDIVECKEELNVHAAINLIDLIETLWNVKVIIDSGRCIAPAI